MENYLQSNKAVKEYADLALKYGGQTEAFNVAWQDKLITEDVNETDLIPTPILNAINVAIKEDKIFKHFKPVFGIDGGKLIIDLKENEAGAQGHKRNAKKTIQQHTLDTRIIMPDAIYKLQRLDHMTFLKGGALVAWVLKELPAYVLARLSQAILVGGVKNEDGTDFVAVKPIKGDALTVETKTPVAADATAIFNQLVEDSTEVEGSNKVAFIDKKVWAKLVTADTRSALPLLMGQLDLGVTMEVVDGKNLGGANYIIVNTDAYLIGFAANGIETLSDFEITENSQYIESRAYVAGSLTQPFSAVVNVPGTPVAG